MDHTERDAGWRTWANLITLGRLALLPVFWWTLFATGHRAIAAWLLGFLGATDWIDGFVARRLHQVSTIGKILDPSVDRLLVTVGLIAVAMAHGVPWWFAGLTLAREALVMALTLLLAALGARRIDVLWWGKVSTFVLMTTYPIFLLTSNNQGRPVLEWQHLLREANWVAAVAGLTLAWAVFVAYVGPASRALREGRASRNTK